MAVEVISPTDLPALQQAARLADVDSKTQAWLDAGTAMVWVVWPDPRTVIVHRPGQPPRILHAQDAITDEEVLPGFQCAVAEFFDD